MTDGGTDTGVAGDTAGLTMTGSGAGRDIAPGLVGRDGCRGDFAPDNSADDGERVVTLGVSITVAVKFVLSAGGSLTGEDVVVFVWAVLALASAILSAVLRRDFFRCSIRASSSLIFLTKSFTSPALYQIESNQQWIKIKYERA